MKSNLHLLCWLCLLSAFARAQDVTAVWYLSVADTELVVHRTVAAAVVAAAVAADMMADLEAAEGAMTMCFPQGLRLPEVLNVAGSRVVTSLVVS